MPERARNASTSARKSVTVCIPLHYRTIPILQEGKSYSRSEEDFSYNPTMDAVRGLIVKKADALKITLAELSRKCGKSHAYFQQFIKRGVPHELPEKIRIKAAHVLKVKESELRFSDTHVVPLGDEFEPDPVEKPETEDDKPFPDAIAQMLGNIGGGSTGAVITIDLGEMQTREPVGAWWRIPPMVLRGLARSDPSRTVAFAMDGDSMEPTIQRTDIVFIDTGRQKVEPDGIWALDYGLGRTMKRVLVRKTKDGVRYVLKSDNGSYPDEEYSPEEVTIFGRYIGRFSVF